MFGRVVIGGGLARVTNGYLGAGFRVRERRLSGWKVTGNAGRAAGSGSPVTGSKRRFIEQIDFAGEGIDLLEFGMGTLIDLCIDLRRDQFP